MPDDHGKAVCDLARRINARATYFGLRDDADELAELVRAIQRPFPAALPTDPTEREFALLIIALRARDHARRLLALVAKGG